MLLWVTIHRTVVKTGLEFPSFLCSRTGGLSIFATVKSMYIERIKVWPFYKPFKKKAAENSRFLITLIRLQAVRSK